MQTKSVNIMVKRNLKKLSKTSDVVRELKKCVEEQGANTVISNKSRRVENCTRI